MRRRFFAALLSLSIPVQALAGTGMTERTVLTQLPALSPLLQIQRLQELSANPALRDLAAAVASPELIAQHRDELESRLGTEQVAALAAIAVNLHVEARGDERVMTALEDLTRRISRDGRVELFLNKAYDGAAPAAAAPVSESARVEPVVAWAVDESADQKQRVHNIGARGGALLIDGKPAPVFRPARARDGVVKEIFIHPNDPGVLVAAYHSPTMDGFEQKTAKVASLTAMAQAGAAPKLIEHGEAAVAGRGRVYFYVQELLHGVALSALPAAERPMAEVRQVFERLAQTGLRLVVPDSSQDWLLSHIMIGKTPEGGARAYVVGGAAERASPESLAAHYEMLLAMLYPSPETKPEEKPAVPAPVKKAADKKSASALYEMLRLLPESSGRDRLILRIPGPAYARTESADIAKILSLVSRSEDPRAVFERLPDEAWRELSRLDAESLASRWPAEGRMDVMSAINELWAPIPALDKKQVGLAGTFVHIRPGAFQMGSDQNEFGRDTGEKLHQVTIKKGFSMQASPVTQLQYFLVMGKNPSHFSGENLGRDTYKVIHGQPIQINHPVENVSWDEAQAFIAKLNAMQTLYTYRLPTEAEWEYAARAGTPDAFPYSFGHNATGELDAHGWYNNNSGGATHPIGSLKPNPWGLYDMHGNVFELVEDGFSSGYEGTPIDGSAFKKKDNEWYAKRHVIRGGSWYSNAIDLRSAHRSYMDKTDRSTLTGFRLVRELRPLPQPGK